MDDNQRNVLLQIMCSERVRLFRVSGARSFIAPRAHHEMIHMTHFSFPGPVVFRGKAGGTVLRRRTVRLRGAPSGRRLGATASRYPEF